MMENRNNFIKNSVKKNLEKKNQKRKKSFVKSLDFVKVENAKYWYPDNPYLGKRFIEYKMPKEIILDLLNNRNDLDKNVDFQKFLCDYVNNEYGLNGYCIRVIEG